MGRDDYIQPNAADPVRDPDAVRPARHYLDSARRGLGNKPGPGSGLCRRRSLSWRFDGIDYPLTAFKAAAKAAQGSLNDVFLAGLIGGITLTLNLERILGAIESVFNVKLLPEDVYYITGLPTDMQTGDVVAITVVALLMSFLATLYPAWRAARTQPAEALRYE